MIYLYRPSPYCHWQRIGKATYYFLRALMRVFDAPAAVARIER